MNSSRLKDSRKKIILLFLILILILVNIVPLLLPDIEPIPQVGASPAEGEYVFIEGTASPYDLMYEKVHSAPGDPVVIDTSESLSATSPPSQSMVRTSDDTIYVVYKRKLGAVYQIYVKYSINEGDTWSDRFLLSDVAGMDGYSQIGQCITIDSEDNLHVVWGGRATGYAKDQIWYRKYNGTWGTTTHVDPRAEAAEYDQSESSIAVDSGDNLHLVWTQFHTDDYIYKIFYTKYSGSWATPIIISTAAGMEDIYSQYTPVLAIDSSDYLHVVWRGKATGFTTNEQIWYATAVPPYAAGNWVTPIRISTETGMETQTQRAACIAIDSGDNLHVVWYGMAAATSNKIWYVKYDGSWATPIIISTAAGMEDYAQNSPVIAVGSTTDLHVIWEGKATDYTDQNKIWYATYTDSWITPEVIQPVGKSSYPNIRWSRWPSEVVFEAATTTSTSTSTSITTTCFTTISILTSESTTCTISILTSESTTCTTTCFTATSTFTSESTTCTTTSTCTSSCFTTTLITTHTSDTQITTTAVQTVIIDGCVTDLFDDTALIQTYDHLHHDIGAGVIHLIDTIMPTNTTDLEGRWGFNEGSGSTAEDTSGNDLDGVITGAEYIEGIDYHTVPPSGFLRYALRFSDADGDFVNVTYGDPLNNSLPYSVEFWFRPRLQTVNITGTIVYGGYAFHVYYDNATGKIVMSYYDGGTWEILESLDSLGTGYTYVVCMWTDETPRTNMTMWFNATAQASGLTVGMPDGALVNSNVYIGRNLGVDSFLSGDLDVVRYYNRTLTVAEMIENFILLADYGVLYSANMFDNLNVTQVVNFKYNATVYTDGNIYVSFSQDNATWVNAGGLSSTETLVNGSNSIILTGLDWSGRVYYRAQFNRTGGLYAHPCLCEVAVCYSTGEVGGWNILVIVVLVASASVLSIVGLKKKW